MKTTFVVRIFDEDQQLTGAYFRMVNLPFVPSIGMHFKLSSTPWLWKTADGSELNPPIKEIVYNLDDKEIYCLFDIDRQLASSYWTQIKNLNDSYELKQFSGHYHPIETPVLS